MKMEVNQIVETLLVDANFVIVKAHAMERAALVDVLTVCNLKAAP